MILAILPDNSWTNLNVSIPNKEHGQGIMARGALQLWTCCASVLDTCAIDLQMY